MKIKFILIFLILAICLSCKSQDSANTNSKSASVTKDVPTKEFSQFKIVESVYNVESAFGDNFLKWAAIIENPNQDSYGLFPTITITARDENGAVIGTEDQVLNELPPGTKIAWAGQISLTKSPKTVEIAPLKVEWRNTKTKPEDYLTFQTDKINITSQGKNFYKVTGDVSNPYNKEIEQIAVVVLLRNNEGKLLGGGTSFVDTLTANGLRPFSVDFIGADEKPEKVEVFAFPWGPASWNKISSVNQSRTNF